MTILIIGRQGEGKSKLAKVLLKHLRQWGFVTVEVFTTNEDICLPASAHKEFE